MAGTSKTSSKGAVAAEGKEQGASPHLWKFFAVVCSASDQRQRRPQKTFNTFWPTDAAELEAP